MCIMGSFQAFDIIRGEMLLFTKFTLLHKVNLIDTFFVNQQDVVHGLLLPLQASLT